MKYLVETQGSGCALLDYDQDGLLDIFLVDGGLTPDSPPVTSQGHRLYRNLGNWKFKDATAGSGIRSTRSYGMGVAVGYGVIVGVGVSTGNSGSILTVIVEYAERSFK